MDDYFDILVIGAGPAGYVAAIRAAQLGLKTAVVEKQRLGGVCLNIGCIPSKALLKNAEVARVLRHGEKEFGFSFENLRLDYPAAVRRSRQVSDRLVKGVGFLMKKNNITVISGMARIQPGKVDDVFTVDVDENEGHHVLIKTKHVILATGASPSVPGLWKVDGSRVLTYKEAILQEKLPTSVIIIGAGAIGMEFATIWNAYGTDVTVVEMMPNILPLEDPEASQEVNKAMLKRGVRIMVASKVEILETDQDGVFIKIFQDGSTIQELRAEQALVAIGFRPNVEDLGLEELGIKLTEKRFIAINNRMETNIPGIWAVGDVTGKLMLAHVGSAMGFACAESIAGLKSPDLDYDAMPRATYCHPQVASFGYSESQAKSMGFDIKVGRFPFQANGKALGLADYGGWVKLVVDEKTGKFLGATLVGPEVTELLPELTLARLSGIPAEEIGRNIHAHPTLSEVLMEAAHSLSGKAIHI
jgi:dihydrolipoamide dehydrogenase